MNLTNCRHFLSVLRASLLITAVACVFSTPSQAAPSDNVWVCGYYLSGDQDSGRLPPEKIDLQAVSHVIHFGLFPNDDGTIGPDSKGIPVKNSLAMVKLAHAAGKKIVVCMGLSQGPKKVRVALEDDIRPKLVRNLVDLVVMRGYDGLDIDIEPLEDADVPTYSKFVHEMRAALDAAGPGHLLMAAVASQPKMFADLQNDFDRVNLMTYDDAGPYPGNRSWHNASLYGGGKDMMNAEEPYYSADYMVQQFLKAGVAPAKLGIGVAFYGYIWSGVSAPKQDITGLTAADIDDGAAYSKIMDEYYQPSRYHWDDDAKAPWLGIDAPEKKDRKFISYDDERLCALKIDYVRQNHLGGVIIWELGAGYRPKQPEGKQDPLLQAVKKEWLGKSDR